MKEKGYYYDENGKYCEIELGPSFDDFPGMFTVASPIPLCDACKKADYVKHMGKYQRNICPQKIIIAHILIMKITVGTS